MRGERKAGTISTGRGDGSSPHARGTQRPRRGQRLRERFIPACAGNAPSLIPDHPAWTVHPRMRGERTTRSNPARVSRGSSPHARGTLAACIFKSCDERFIPACAGNADTSGKRASAATVHPRMRGERRRAAVRQEGWPGSSPHARGTLGSVTLRRHLHRFIPACAGNADTVPRPPVWMAVHPRMRGERRFQAVRTGWPCGSSPHARGTQPTLRNSDYSERFIPACAGNACLLSQQLPDVPVHPRMRGERPRRARAVIPAAGSSPHARGTPWAKNVTQSIQRFIPACAGNAIGFDFANFDLSVHPRMRGERTRFPSLAV